MYMWENCSQEFLACFSIKKGSEGVGQVSRALWGKAVRCQARSRCYPVRSGKWKEPTMFRQLGGADKRWTLHSWRMLHVFCNM